MDSDENFNLAAREVQFIWHVHPGASGIQNLSADRIIIQINSIAMKGSYSCPCSTTFNGQTKAIQIPGCTMRKKWQNLRPRPSQDTGSSWGLRQNIRGGTENPTSLRENEISSQCRCITHSSVTSHPIFPATEP